MIGMIIIYTQYTKNTNIIIYYHIKITQYTSTNHIYNYTVTIMLKNGNFGVTVTSPVSSANHHPNYPAW
jgi:hypothetical protein